MTVTRFPPAPGRVLQERVLKGMGLQQAELARALGLSRARLNMILKGKSHITPEVALRLGRVVGPSAEYWLELRGAWELCQRGKQLRRELNRLTNLAARA
jgi:addiction module HigA family antidote